jgi:acyl-CoA synthetase (AMP-forming)/AMP-acid ligase II
MRADDVEGLTVGSLLDLVAERRPDDDALVYPDRGLRYTYGEFKEVVERCARALMALGLEKGDHVAVWGQNVPEWVTLQFATGKMGAVLVTVNASSSPRCVWSSTRKVSPSKPRRVRTWRSWTSGSAVACWAR